MHVGTQAFLSVCGLRSVGAFHPASPSFIPSDEGNQSHQHRPDVPSRRPFLFVVVRESGADILVDFKAARRSEELDLGGREGIVFCKFHHPVVKASFVGFVQAVHAEVEIEDSFSLDDDVRQGVVCERPFLLVETSQGEVGALH